MGKPVLTVAAFVAVLLTGVSVCFEWQVVPQSTIYGCQGGRASFPWLYTLSDRETLTSVRWLFQGQFASEMVATLAHGYFLPTDKYAQRVEHVANAGFVLSDLAVDDTGNVTVEVSLLDGNDDYLSYRNAVQLQVGDEPMVAGGKLRARQDPEALWDDSSRRWRIRLACGVFTFLGPPPFNVSWTTPDGQVIPSSTFHSGEFYLSLHAPVQGGNYTCVIPVPHLADVCFHRDDDDHTASATVVVEAEGVRLSLLEAELRTLKEENRGLRERLDRAEQGLHNATLSFEQQLSSARLDEQEMAENLTHYIQDTKKTCESSIETVTEVQQSLQDEVRILGNLVNTVTENLNTLMNSTTPSPTERAVLTGPCSPQNHSVLDDPTRAVDHDKSDRCDKDLAVGWYRFLLSGANAVIPTTCVPKNKCNTHASMWLDLQSQPLPAPGHEAKVRGCAHWDDSCCKWQTPVTVHNCGAFFVYHIQPRKECSLRFCLTAQNG